MTDARRELNSAAGDESRFDETLDRVLAGRGSGLRCAHCQELITAAEVEYEIVEPVDAADSNAQQGRPRLHLRCYESWRATCGPR
jgi:hypothetical protein